MLHYLGTFKLLRMRRLSTLYLLGFSPQRCVFKNLTPRSCEMCGLQKSRILPFYFIGYIVLY